MLYSDFRNEIKLLLVLSQQWPINSSDNSSGIVVTQC